MNLLTAGLSVLRTDLIAVALFLLVPAGYGLPLVRALDPGPRWVRLPLALALGPLPVALLFFPVILLGRLWPPALTLGAWAIALGGLVLLVAAGFTRRPAHAEDIQPAWLLTGGLLLLLLVVARLAFLDGMLLPPYNDAASHYETVLNFLTPDGSRWAWHSLESLTDSYYHVGFHSLAAWLTTVAGLPAERTIPLSAQLLLVLMPCGTLALVGRLTRDPRAAALAGLAAAAGWPMPAFAANWAKYPALAALCLLPAVLAALHALHEQRGRAVAWLAGAAAVIGLTFLHTRALIVVLLFAALWLLAGRLPARPRWLAPASAGLLLALAAYRFWLASGGLLAAYCGDRCAVSLAILLLTPLAALAYPTAAAALAAGSLLLFGLYRLPTGGLLAGLNTIHWIDPPFLQIGLYLPLAALGGLGLAGLFARIRPAGVRAGLTALLAAGLLVNARATIPAGPDACCRYVQPEDLQAMAWIRANADPRATILIAGVETQGACCLATDAGAWVRALTGRTYQYRPFPYAWDEPAVMQELCPFGEVYIYVGSTPFGFSRERLGRPGWYERAFQDGPVTIYRPLGCGPP